MAQFSVSGIRIAGISAAVPGQRVDNRELDGIAADKLETLIQTTGIRFRHVAPPEICTSDLCETAATRLLEAANWTPQDIDVLVLVTQTPDQPIPGSATLLQERLGLRKSVIALDINNGCAGYVYGLSVISSLMHTSGLKRALLLVGDTITRTIGPKDLSLAPIFSDAGSATLLERDNSAGPMHFQLGSDGSGASAIQLTHGGARNPITSDALIEQPVSDNILRSQAQLSMRGHAVFTFGLTQVQQGIRELMDFAQLTPENVDYLVLHQANQLLQEALRKKLGFEKDQTPSSLHDYGNTSSATIPITLIAQLRNQLRQQSNDLLLSGFGVGLSWGNVFVHTTPIVCPEIIYL